MPLYIAPSISIIAQSAVAVPHTGDTAETILATITIPAGAMGLNGVLEIDTQWAWTNSGNNKTARVRFGGISGTQFMNFVATTSASLRMPAVIANRDAANSQVGSLATSGNPFNVSTATLPTAAVDTTADVSLVITGQCASAADTITLERYSVKLVRP